MPQRAPQAQLPRTDLLASVVSMIVAALTVFGLLPVDFDPQLLIAVGTGLFAAVAIVRALWERRAELRRQTMLDELKRGAATWQGMYMAALTRHEADVQRLESARQLVQRAADPADETQLSPAAVLELLNTPTSSFGGAYEIVEQPKPGAPTPDA